MSHQPPLTHSPLQPHPSSPTAPSVPRPGSSAVLPICLCVCKDRPGPRFAWLLGLNRALWTTRVQGREETGLSQTWGVSSVTTDHRVACRSPQDVTRAAGGPRGHPRPWPVQLDPVVQGPCAFHQRVCRVPQWLCGHLPGNGPRAPGPCGPHFLGSLSSTRSRARLWWPFSWSRLYGHNERGDDPQQLPLRRASRHVQPPSHPNSETTPPEHRLSPRPHVHTHARVGL